MALRPERLKATLLLAALVTLMIGFRGARAGAPDMEAAAEAVVAPIRLQWQVRSQNSPTQSAGPFRSFSPGDVDADGQPELLTTARSWVGGYYASGPWYIHNATDGSIEYASPQSHNFGYEALRIGSANVDADPQHEVFLVLRDFYGLLVCVDAVTREEQWRKGFSSGIGLSSLQLADIDRDGDMEVVLGTEVITTGAYGTHIYVLDARTGVQEWRSPLLSYSFSALDFLRVANVDSDANWEIVAGAEDGPVFVADPTAGTTIPLPDFDTSALDTADLDNDGIDEIVIGTRQGALFTVDPFTGAIVRTLGQWDAPVDAVAVHDMDGAPGPEFVVAVLNQLVVFRRGGCVVAKSGVLGSNVGKSDAMIAEDIDADGRVEIVVGIGYVGFDVHEVTLAPADPCMDFLGGLDVADASIAEGNSGVANLVFTVTLPYGFPDVVTVVAETSDLSATAGVDYTAVGPVTLTFAPGVTSQTVSVPILGDPLPENDETLKLTLSNATNAPIFDDVAIGTILNDEPPLRTFVSTGGDDTSNCSIQATPCRSIAAALAQTAEDGEVIILKTGEYETAPLTIQKGISITSPSGTVALIGQPLTINAPGRRVALRGLTLKGAGALTGLTLLAVDTLAVEDSSIDGWEMGLRLQNAAGATVAISGTVVRNNATGIVAAASNRISVSESRFERNTKGLEVLAGAVWVRDSAFVANAESGMVIGPGVAEIHRSEFHMNGNAVATRTGGSVRVGRSQIFGNVGGFVSGAGTTFETWGTNVVRGNGTDTSGTITAIPEQ